MDVTFHNPAEYNTYGVGGPNIPTTATYDVDAPSLTYPFERVVTSANSIFGGQAINGAPNLS